MNIIVYNKKIPPWRISKMFKKELFQLINNIKQSYYSNSSNKHSNNIVFLLSEIQDNISKITSDYHENAIKFAVEYLNEENDLFPDTLSFGLLDDYLVLKFVVYKVIYKYDDSICYSAINRFLNYNEIKELIKTAPIEFKNGDEVSSALTSKLKQLNRFESKLRLEIIQIIKFLKKILTFDSNNLQCIAQWALMYFLNEDDAICDTTDFGYVDDFLVLKSAEMAIKEKLYDKYQKHFKYLSDYEHFFLPLYFKKQDKPIHLNDFQKIISMYFFEQALIDKRKRNFGIVLPEQSALTKTLIYFYYQLGLLAKSYFVKNSKDDILMRLKNGERILCNKKDIKKQYIFDHEENKYYVFYEKENKQGKKSKKNSVIIKLPEEAIFNEPYEVIPSTSRGNLTNRIQHDFINNYLRLIVANYFSCSLSEIELIDADPKKIIFSPIGRVYNINHYNQLSINEMGLNKIFPVANIEDDGEINSKLIQCSAQHGFINACKTNYPSIARNLLVDDPADYNALFIDFSGINQYQDDNSKILNDSDSKNLKIPIFSFYNISQIAFEKFEHSEYYAVNQELAGIISLSYYSTNNTSQENPYDILSNFEINNFYVGSPLFILVEDFITQFKSEEKSRDIYDLLYHLSSLKDDDLHQDEINETLQDILPNVDHENLKTKITDHSDEYKNALTNILDKHRSASFSIFSTKMSSEYIGEICRKKNIKANNGRVHNIQKYPYNDINVIIPFYKKGVYNAILYPKARHVYYIIDGTKEKIHEERLTAFKAFLKLDSESMLSGGDHKKPESILFSDILEDDIYHLLYNELGHKINDSKYQNERKIDCCLVSFDDNSRRFIALNSFVQLLDMEDEGSEENTKTKIKARDLLPGDPVILYGSHADDFDDSLTGIFLKNNKINNLFQKTQSWRNALRDLLKEKNDDIHGLQTYLKDKKLEVTEATLKNWINKEYQVYLQKKDDYIPIIFKLRSKKEEKARICIDDINIYLRLRHSLGRRVKSFLIHDFSEGKKNIEEWILHFTHENNVFLFSKNDTAVIQGLNHILANIEVLRVENIHKYENPVPQSWIWKRMDQV